MKNAFCLYPSYVLKLTPYGGTMLVSMPIKNEGAAATSPATDPYANALDRLLDALVFAGNDNPVSDVMVGGRWVVEQGRHVAEDAVLAGYRRAANILRIEEKKDSRAYDGAPDLAHIEASGQPEEKALAEALGEAVAAAKDAVAAEDFEGAMRALSRLRAPVDAFFDKVTVNADDARLRENRLFLLNALREATRTVADFARIEG